MKYNVALLHLIIYMGLLSCKSGGNIHVYDNLMEYAHVISISDNDGIAVSVRNPWKEGAFLQNFILSEKAGRDYVYMPGSSSEIRTPFRKVVVMTNSVARLINELGMVGSIAGVCDAQYIRDPEIVSRIQDGRIIDCGDGMNPDVEKIMDLQPDAIFVSPFENAGYGQLEKLGVPLIECAEYMETSPLGRAEWMRFYGRLLGVRERADSLFRSVRDAYVAMKSLADSVQSRPSVMVDTRSGAAWYIPGGHSTIGQMIADAGGNYLFSYLENSGSVPLSFETVYDKALDADIWLLKSRNGEDLTYPLLKADNEGYAAFRPFRRKNVWVCNVDAVPYFELTSFHPDLLLRDMIGIFHPEIKAGSPFFYAPMQD